MLLSYRHALLHLLLSSLACAALGYLLGSFSSGLIFGMGLWSAWYIYQLHRLTRSLQDCAQGETDFPLIRGPWGEVFQALETIQARELAKTTHIRHMQKRVQAAVTALDEAIVLIDARGCLELWNSAAEKLLGIAQRKDKDLAVADLIQDEAFMRFYTQGKADEELESPSPLDPTRMLHFRLFRYGDGEALLMVRDITRMHSLEQMRKEFVSNVSHELRTPLTVLSGYIETLQGLADQQLQHPLQKMHNQAQRMQALINDLLLLSSLENSRTRSDISEVELHDFLEDIIIEAEALSRGQHQLELICDESMSMQAHAPELRSALSNIVFNAVKYTPEGGKITVEAYADQQLTAIAVSDNGDGIEAMHITRLTERFYRVDSSRAQATGGTGLGLAIVKHVLIQHGGRLKIDSRLGKGSCFTCIFPKESEGSSNPSSS